MRIIAKKPCSFEGKKFFINDEIPAELVAKPKEQEAMGTIAIVSDGELTPEELQNYTAQVGIVKFEVMVHAEEGDLTLEVTNDELSVFTDILQIGVNKTEDKQNISELIQKVESMDLLIMLDALDGRKFVKEEAQARSQVLLEQMQEDEQEEQPDGEQPGGDEIPEGEEQPDGEQPDGEQPGGDE